MKKKFLVSSFIVLSVIMAVSCNSKSTPDVSGKWTSQVKYKSMLPADINDPEGPECGAMFTIQSREIEFSDLEKGEYSEKIVTYIEKFEYTSEKPAYLDEEALKAAADTELSLKGKYIHRGKYIDFQPDTVTDGEGNTAGFNDYADIDENAALLSGNRALEVSADGTMLSLESIDYKRVE